MPFQLLRIIPLLSGSSDGIADSRAFVQLQRSRNQLLSVETSQARLGQCNDGHLLEKFG